MVDLLLLLLLFRMESVYRILLHEQSLVQETHHPDQRLLASLQSHRRQLATSLETVKWQVDIINTLILLFVFCTLRVLLFLIVVCDCFNSLKILKERWHWQELHQTSLRESKLPFLGTSNL